MSEASAQQLTKEQRITAYLDALERLRRERTSLREVLEREILLAFIRINRNNLNEFPLLETQQRSVIDLLCQRSDHPAYEYVRKLTGNFLVLLNRLAKALPSGDETLAEQTRSHLLNTETLLIKCMQGIIFASGLITDNFEELVLRNYGEGALPAYNDLLKKHELDRSFWQALLARFVAEPVGEAHKAILAEDRFSMAKDGKMLVVRFYMDDVLARLNPSVKNIEKTRIQKAFEERSRGYEGRRTLRLVTNCLHRGLTFIPREQLGASGIESLARIACVDDVSQHFRTSYQERLQRKNLTEIDPEEDARHKQQFNFYMEQVVATGVGALISVAQTRNEFSAALGGVIAEQTAIMQTLGKNLSLDNLQRVLSALLEDHLAYRLRKQAEGEGGTVQVHKSRTRRAAAADVEALFNTGLTRIRKNKLWRRDPAREDMLLFRPRNAQELQGMCRMLQVEKPLFAAIVRLWEADSHKVEILLTVDLARLGRRTTNLALRLRELLTKFGLVKNAEEPAPPPQEEQDAGRSEEQRESAPPENGESSTDSGDHAPPKPDEPELQEGALWGGAPDKAEDATLVAENDPPPASDTPAR